MPTEAELLEACAASGQMDSRQVAAHVEAGEMEPAKVDAGGLSTERIDALLNALDDVAREHDIYEYGLPMIDLGGEDQPINKLRAVVREWAATPLPTYHQQEKS